MESDSREAEEEGQQRGALLKVKEGDGEKLVEVRVFANAEHIKDPVPEELLK